MFHLMLLASLMVAKNSPSSEVAKPQYSEKYLQSIVRVYAPGVPPVSPKTYHFSPPDRLVVEANASNGSAVHYTFHLSSKFKDTPTSVTWFEGVPLSMDVFFDIEHKTVVNFRYKAEPPEKVTPVRGTEVRSKSPMMTLKRRKA